MKIVVVGGTGLVGSKVASRLANHGVDTVVATPASCVDAVTGAGLAEALDGAHAVVDVSNPRSFDDADVMHFFTTSTANLLACAAAAGVHHHIALSVVGAQRLADGGYFRAKVAQERLVAASTTPFTIVRATQFFEFLGPMADAATCGTTVRVAPVQVQPLAADDVAVVLADAAVGEPVNSAKEVAGPERFRLDELLRRWLRAHHDRRAVSADASARYFGAPLSERTLLPADGATIGRTRLGDWLTRSRAARSTVNAPASADHGVPGPVA